jgi:ADP-ribosyl-[dinitrogen reductase] hydrolase
MDIRSRFRGCLLGLAAGDALGTTLEFQLPGSFTPITDMIGGGPFRLAPGQWTDDTSMALCLAESLIECQGFDPIDQLQRYVRWYREGYLSSTGRCFDIGNTVSGALHRFERTGDPASGPTHPHTAGNGSIMRLAPIPMFYAAQPGLAVERAAQSSRTTHGARAAVDACRYFGGLLVGALTGVDRAALLAERYAPYPGCWDEHPLAPEIDRVAAGSFRHQEPPHIAGTGYVVQSLEAALWAFHKSDSFQEGALLAANLGNDADTTAAVYGQLAGAYYGEAGIPGAWRERLAKRELLEEHADRLYELHSRPHPEV